MGKALERGRMRGAVLWMSGSWCARFCVYSMQKVVGRVFIFCGIPMQEKFLRHIILVYYNFIVFRTFYILHTHLHI